MLKRSVATLRAFETVDGFINNFRHLFCLNMGGWFHVLFHLPQKTKHSLTCHIYVHAELNQGFWGIFNIPEMGLNIWHSGI